MKTGFCLTILLRVLFLVNIVDDVQNPKQFFELLYLNELKQLNQTSKFKNVRTKALVPHPYSSLWAPHTCPGGRR